MQTLKRVCDSRAVGTHVVRNCVCTATRPCDIRCASSPAHSLEHAKTFPIEFFMQSRWSGPKSFTDELVAPFGGDSLGGSLVDSKHGGWQLLIKSPHGQCSACSSQLCLCDHGPYCVPCLWSLAIYSEHAKTLRVGAAVQHCFLRPFDPERFTGIRHSRIY